MGGAASIEELEAVSVGLLQPIHGKQTSVAGDKATIQSESSRNVIEIIVFDQFLMNSSITLFRSNLKREAILIYARIFSLTLVVRLEFYYFLEANHRDDLAQLTFFLRNSHDNAGVHSADIILTILRFFPQFLVSPSYQEWMNHELGIVTESQPDRDVVSNQLFSVAGVKTSPDLNTLRRLMISCVYHIPDCNNLLQKDTWFRSLVESVDQIDLSVFVTLPSLAKKFPVLYANSKLEKLTGLPRHEIMGAGCKFYNLNRLPDSIRLWKRLSASAPSRFFTNLQCNNGLNSRVVVMCKPIYDMYGKYRFILNAASADTSESGQSYIAAFFHQVPDYFTV